MRHHGLAAFALALVLTTNSCDLLAPKPEPTQLAFEVVPPSAVAGANFHVVVNVLDKKRKKVGSVPTEITLHVTAGAGASVALKGNVTSTSANGAASFDVNIEKAGVGYTLTAEATGLTSAVSESFAIVPGAPAKLGIMTQPPATVTAGVALSPAVQVGVLDAFDNLTSSATTSVALAITDGTGAAGASLTGVTSRTSAGGLATFTGIAIERAATGYTLTASSAGLASATTTALSVSPGAPSKLMIVANPRSAAATDGIGPVKVAATDAFANIVPTATPSIAIDISSGTGAGGARLSGTKTRTAAAGIATFDDISVDKAAAGYTLQATGTGLGAVTTAAFDVTVGAAKKLAWIKQPGNSTGGSAIPAVEVAIQDAGGNTVTTAGASITIAITDGAGTAGAKLGGTVTRAASNGVAAFSSLSIDKVGSAYTLTASAEGLTSAKSLPFDVTVGPAAQLAFRTQPTNAVAGAAIAPEPQVEVRDAGGNLVASPAVDITVAITSGTGATGAALGGTKVRASESGVATFAGLSIDKAATNYTLTASATSLSSAVSSSFAIGAGAAAKLGVVVQPANTTGGAEMSPAPKIAVQDASGNTVPGATNTIAIAITSATGASGAVLSGTKSRAAVDGVAEFAGLSIDKTGTGYKLTATATGLTSVVTATFSVTVGAAAKLAFTVQPPNTQKNGVLVPAVKVAIQDAGGNTVTSVASTPVTVAIASGTGTAGAVLAGNVTQSSGAGVSTFDNLTIDKAGTGYKLSATATGFTAATSATFDIVETPAVSLAFKVQPSTTKANTIIAPAIEVSIKDASGSVVPGATNSVSLAITGGTGASGAILNGVVVRTAVAGVATFDDVNVTKAGTGYTLTASASALTSATSTAFDIISDAKKLVLTTAPSANAPNRTAFPVQPVVQLQDVLGAVVSQSGVVVTAAITAGGGTLGGTAMATTNASGTATFTNLQIAGTIGARTLTFSATDITSTTASVNVTAGAASSIAMQAGNNQTANGGTAVPVKPAVIVKDQDGNVVNGVAVTFGTLTGGGSLADPSQTTNSSGIATVGNWFLGDTPGANTMKATSGTLTGSPVTFTATGVATELQNDVAVLVSGAKDAMKYYRINVPAGRPQLVVSITGGSGDADLHVRFGQIPTTTTYDCRPFKDGNEETCSFPTPAAGDWFIAVQGFAAFDNVQLRAVHTAAPMDLTIENLYVVQATQTPGRTVPLVSGRAALVRVFGKASASNAESPSVRVRLYRNGVLVQTYTPAAGSAGVATLVDEGALTKSWNVTIPAAEMTTNLSILADIDPANTVAETNETNNSYPASGTPLALDVRNVPAYNVTLVPVLQQPNGRTGSVADQESYVEYAKRIHPLSTVSTNVHATYTYSGTVGTDASGMSQLLSEINALRNAEATGRAYYGVFQHGPSCTSGVIGLGYIGQPAAVGWDCTSTDGTTTWRASTSAHEWGHNFGRFHSPCGGPSGVDASYPYSGGDIGVFGYDFATNAVMTASSQYDYMSYCHPPWTSDYTYKGVMDSRGTSTSIVSLASAPEPSYLIWGRIAPEGIVLEPAFEITAQATPLPRSGPYLLEAFNAQGQRVLYLSFEGETLDHREVERHFSFVIPKSQLGELASIRLRANGREAVRSSAAPDAIAAASAAVASARAAGFGRSRVTWNSARYPAALIRDAATGQVVSIARGGAVDVLPRSQNVDVVLSDGVRSTTQRIRAR